MFYSYVNEDNNVLLAYDINSNYWKLIYTDTDLSSIDGTQNSHINIIDQVSWSSISDEIGNSATYIPEAKNSNGAFYTDGVVDLIDDGMPIKYKVNGLFVMDSSNFIGKFTSKVDGQQVNILLSN